MNGDGMRFISDAEFLLAKLERVITFHYHYFENNKADLQKTIGKNCKTCNCWFPMFTLRSSLAL